MKCVKKQQDGKVVRVKDTVAAQLVKQNEATYVSKSVWRASKTKEAQNGSP